MTRHDLVVVGAGPAGLAAAIAGRMAGLQVAVLEPRCGPIEKACGQGLMPSGVAALGALGVSSLPGVPFLGVRYEHASDPTCVASGRFSGGPGLGVRRAELSAALFSRAQELGVILCRRPARGLSLHGDRVEVGGLSARYVIAADGLRSTVRRLLGMELPAAYTPRFGVVRHFHRPPWSEDVVVMLAAGAEAYVTAVAADEIGVAILHRPPQPFDALLPRFPTLAARLEGARQVGRDRGAGPFEQRVAARVVGRVLLVGDAAGYMDPLTGEGLSLGVKTARAAVDCIVRGQAKDYEWHYRALTRRYYLGTRILLKAIERPGGHRPLLRAAAISPRLCGALLDLFDGGPADPAGPMATSSGRNASAAASCRASHALRAAPMVWKSLRCR